MNKNCIVGVGLIAILSISLWFMLSFYNRMEQSDPSNLFTTNRTIIAQNLHKIPEMIQINGHNYSMETYMWRDFMPISPPQERPMIAIINIVDMDNKEENVSKLIDVDKLWVIKNVHEIWETAFENEERPVTKYTLEKVAREGPYWDPYIYVDVVVKIMDITTKNNWLLKASNQQIHMTM